MTETNESKFKADLIRRATGEAKIAARAMEDSAFREKLMADPKAALAEAAGIELPDNVKLVVHEESADTLHMVIPPALPEELTDEQLEAVAGGAAFMVALGAGAAIGAAGGAAIAAGSGVALASDDPW